MRNIERITLSVLLSGGCLAPPTEVIGEQKPAPPIAERPTTAPTPDESQFLEETRRVEIRGDDIAIRETHDALRTLKNKAEIHYNRFLRYLKVSIIEFGAAGEQSTATQIYLVDSPPRIFIDAQTRVAGLLWYAGVLAHEACHAEQFFTFKEKNPDQPVPIEMFSGPQREKECGAVQYDTLKLLGAPEELLDHVKIGYSL